MSRRFVWLLLIWLVACCDAHAHHCPEDLNGSGAVNFYDFTLFARCFGKDYPDKVCRMSDFDGDGNVAFSDYLIFAQAFGKDCSTPLPLPTIPTEYAIDFATCKGDAIDRMLALRKVWRGHNPPTIDYSRNQDLWMERTCLKYYYADVEAVAGGQFRISAWYSTERFASSHETEHDFIRVKIDASDVTILGGSSDTHVKVRVGVSLQGPIEVHGWHQGGAKRSVELPMRGWRDAYRFNHAFFIAPQSAVAGVTITLSLSDKRPKEPEYQTIRGERVIVPNSDREIVHWGSFTQSCVLDFSHSEQIGVRDCKSWRPHGGGWPGTDSPNRDWSTSCDTVRWSDQSVCGTPQ